MHLQLRDRELQSALSLCQVTIASLWQDLIFMLPGNHLHCFSTDLTSGYVSSLCLPLLTALCCQDSHQLNP